MERQRLRVTFEEVPELYDRARPTYPPELLDDLVALARLRRGARVLEIGCGTGQATIPLAERDLEIVCVELGERLAAVARRNLAGYPNVEVANADFENWQPTGDAFDAVVAFTAFHWVDPGVRYEKSAALLNAGGALAVIATQHVLPEGGDSFFADVQEDYDVVAPDPDNRAPPRPEEVDDLASEIEASGRFRKTAVRRYLWDVTYSADEYIALLETYSGHRALDDDTRQRLYLRIRRRIESRPRGRVTKTSLATLNVAKRL